MEIVGYFKFCRIEEKFPEEAEINYFGVSLFFYSIYFFTFRNSSGSFGRESSSSSYCD